VYIGSGNAFFLSDDGVHCMFVCLIYYIYLYDSGIGYQHYGVYFIDIEKWVTYWIMGVVTFWFCSVKMKQKIEYWQKELTSFADTSVYCRINRVYGSTVLGGEAAPLITGLIILIIFLSIYHFFNSWPQYNKQYVYPEAMSYTEAPLGVPLIMVPYVMQYEARDE